MTGPRSVSPPAGAAISPPNPPATIAGTERFIALAIRFVRIVPDAPTIIPATIKAVLLSATPVAAAERPVNAFSSEITTGMSAPPIGSTTMFPRTAATSRIPRMNSACECVPAARMIALTSATANSPRLITACKGSLIGWPGKIAWSFPNAMFEPQNETDPMTAANSDGISVLSGKSPPKWWRYSIQAISAVAPPPTPLNSATICGIAVIWTLRAAGIPIAVPITSPSAISQGVLDPLSTCGVSSVAMNASAIPVAAIRFPRTAVRGPVSPLIP